MSKRTPELEFDIERFMRGEQPTREELGAAPKLTNWHACAMVNFRGDRLCHLQGTVRGHQHIRDGQMTTTSELRWLDYRRKWARTETQIYALEDEADVAYRKADE